MPGPKMKKEETYFVIRTDDRGQASVEAMTRKEIEKMIEELNEDTDGEFTDDFLTLGTEPSSKREIDLAYEGNKYIVIKGEVIIPKAVTKVTKYEI